jgi:hypothetical protein
MNRLKEYFQEPEPDAPESDYYVISGDCGYFYVSRETATRVERCLDRVWVPRWVTFTDLSGSQVRIRTCLIHCVFESTTTQRAYEREFHRARKLEEKADRRPWEED